MKKGGLLDGFPLYLLAGSRDNVATIILDSPDLGRLQMSPVPEGSRIVIVIADTWQGLEMTREALEDFDISKTHFLLSSFEKLPFRNHSVEGIVRHLNRKAEAVTYEPENGIFSSALGETARILSNTGWIIGISREPSLREKREGDKIGGYTEMQRYYVRPSSGPQYFVTKKLTPSPWPFKPLQLGRYTTIRNSIDLLVSRLKVRTLLDCAAIMVFSKRHNKGLIDICKGRNNDKTKKTYQCAFGLYVKSRWNALLLGSDENKVIVKFPLSSVICVRMKRNADNIEAIYTDGNPVSRTILPMILDQGVISGQAYWTEKYCKGASSAKWRSIPGWKRKVAEAAFHFLIEIHRSSSRSVKMHRYVFDDLLNPHVATVEEEARKLDPGFDLKPIVRALWRIFRGRHIPLVRTHGDFWPGNIIISEAGELNGVLDWDASVRSGWPLLDLLHFIAYQSKRRAYGRFGSVVPG